MNIHDLYAMLGRLHAETQLLRAQLEQAQERIKELEKPKGKTK